MKEQALGGELAAGPLLRGCREEAPALRRSNDSPPRRHLPSYLPSSRWHLLPPPPRLPPLNAFIPCRAPPHTLAKAP